MREALHAGALGYVLKESLSSDLIAAIEHALAGRRYVSPVLSEQILDAYAHPPSQAQFDPYQQLSEREQAVFVLTAQGRTNSAIAAHLGLSSRTVESHRANLMRKLGLQTLADLVRYAIRRGLITLDDHKGCTFRKSTVASHYRTYGHPQGVGLEPLGGSIRLKARVHATTPIGLR